MTFIDRHRQSSGRRHPHHRRLCYPRLSSEMCKIGVCEFPPFPTRTSFTIILFFKAFEKEIKMKNLNKKKSDSGVIRASSYNGSQVQKRETPDYVVFP